jgi:hypothetical protein
MGKPGERNLGIMFGTMNMAGNLGSLAFTWILPRLRDWDGRDAGLTLFAGMNLAAVARILLNPSAFIGERPVSAAREG